MVFALAVSSLSNATQLIRYNNQLVVVEQCFPNITAIQNMGYFSKFEPTNSMADITDMSKYRNAGIWSMD